MSKCSYPNCEFDIFLPANEKLCILHLPSKPRGLEKLFWDNLYAKMKNNN